jgi:predicted DNA-binding transcriptional regulator YafY
MRAGRLVELLGLLQARGRMTAAQLAAGLEVSQRTILRDMEALSAAGFPVYAVRGSLGGFELLAGSSIGLPASGLSRRPAQPAGTSQRARVRLSPRGRRLATLSGRPAGLRVRRNGRPVAGRAGWVEAWMPVDSVRAAAEELLALGADAEVIEPAELRDLVRANALQIAELYGHDTRAAKACASGAPAVLSSRRQRPVPPATDAVRG